MSRGRLFVFEGIDGAGTTTQIRLYAEHLRGLGYEVHVTAEPSLGPLGNVTRWVMGHRLQLADPHRAEIMALLFAADRLDHLATEIEPRIAGGQIVLSDRYDLSSLAYQSATSGSSAPDTVDWIRTLNRHARRPDATLVLDVDPALASQRRHQRGGTPELYEDDPLQSALAQCYASAAALLPEGDRVVHVDGGRAMVPVQEDVRAALDPLLPPDGGGPRTDGR